MYQAMPYNQFYGPQFQPQMQRMQPQPQPQMQPEMQFNQQPMYRQPSGLQGKSVDNVEVVKATDIPLDGSISYFPLTDGSAIVTKQLQQDGTSKTVIYKPVEDKNVDNVTAFITSNELEDRLSKIKTVDYKEDIKKLNRKIEDLTDEIDKLHKASKNRGD